MQPSGALALWAYRWRRRRVLRAGGGAVASAVAFAVIAVTAGTRVLAVHVALAFGGVVGIRMVAHAKQQTRRGTIGPSGKGRGGGCQQ